MELKQKIEEALGIVWIQKEKGNSDIKNLKKIILEEVGEDVLENLIKEGYIILDVDKVIFTDKGKLKAKDIIRRQRLAERLLVDVLEVGKTEMASSACEFEHIISKEVEEAICTLLGHPKQCPHGDTIPEGECCIRAKDSVESIVVPLTKLSCGNVAKIVYILTHSHPQLHKLMSLGIIPGTLIVLHQSFPTYIIEVEQTQIALEKEVANNIYVKKIK